MKAFFIALLTVFPLVHAQSSKELLRDGLFAEESEGDLKTATEKYEQLLKTFEQERKVAAVALYRLAAVKRKEGDEKGALALYEEFARKFGDIEPQAGLVKENYLALSGKALAVGEAVLSEEDKELARLKKLAVTSPDLLKKGEGMQNAIRKGWIRVVSYLLKNGASPNLDGPLHQAVSEGHLEICRLLLEAGADPDEPGFGRRGGALRLAVEEQYLEITKLLIEKGADPSGLKGILQDEVVFDLTMEELTFLVRNGADLNYSGETVSERKYRLPPLHRAVLKGDHQLVRNLLKLGAKVDTVGLQRVQAIHVAVVRDDEEMIEILLEAGADLNATMVDEGVEITPVGPSDRDWKTFCNRWNSQPLTYPIRPIDLVSSEQIPFLLEKGAEPTPEVLRKVILAKDQKALQALIGKGVDLNKQIVGSGKWPLDLASGEILEILLRHGARKVTKPWEELILSVRDPALRRKLYPKLSSPDHLVVVMPELGPDFGTLGTLLGVQEIMIKTDAISSVLLIEFPFIARRRSTPGADPFAMVKDDCDLLAMTWGVFRGGALREVDWQKVSPTTFQAGDVIEITGFDKAFLRQVDPNRRSVLRDRLNHPIPNALLKLQRFPVKLTLDGRTWDLMICPDKSVWDARTNEIPMVGVRELLQLIENAPPFGGRMIVIDRQGIGEVTYDENDPVLGSYPLQANDHIKVVLPEEAENEALRTKLRAGAIELFSPGTPGNRRWVANDGPPPTLLQLLSDLNPGLSFPDQGTKAREFRPSQQAARVFPAIDLSKVVIHRLAEEGEKTIDVNLQEKVEEWTKNGKKEVPFDFQLQGGDRIELALRKEGPLGLLDDEVAYFKAALEVSFVVQELKKPPYRQEVAFAPFEWVETLGGPVPTQKDGQEMSVRKGQLSIDQNSPFLLQRKGASHQFGKPNHISPKSLQSFWPQEGDLLTEQNYLPFRLPEPRKR